MGRRGPAESQRLRKVPLGGCKGRVMAEPRRVAAGTEPLAPGTTPVGREPDGNGAEREWEMPSGGHLFQFRRGQQ